MLINIKIPAFGDILTFMSGINFMLVSVQHEKVYNLEARCLIQWVKIFICCGHKVENKDVR